MYCEHCHEFDTGALTHECIGSLRAERDALQARVKELELPPNSTVVDSGALTLAINVLRRAGKDEVADALMNTAVRIK